MNIFEEIDRKNIEKIKDLTNKGTDLEARDEYGNTPLIKAAEKK